MSVRRRLERLETRKGLGVRFTISAVPRDWSGPAPTQPLTIEEWIIRHCGEAGGDLRGDQP